MLAKKNRLQKPNYKRGVFLKTVYFNLKIFENLGEDPKFAFVISKKISGSAVIRNKNKRFWAEAIRVNLQKIKKGAEATLIVKKLFDQEQDKANKIIAEEFKKAKIIK